MKNINLDHWGIMGNEASISLINLHAGFHVLVDNGCVYFQLVVTDSDMKTLTLYFYTLEDVIMFVEDVVSKCFTKEKVWEKYQKMFEKDLFSFPSDRKLENKDTFLLNPNKVDQILIDYFGKEKDYRISIKRELYVDFHGNSKISFYLIEHLDYDGIKKDIQTMLTKGDIRNALVPYVAFYGYELVDFKYIAGMSYDGIKIEVKKLDMDYSKKLSLNLK